MPSQAPGSYPITVRVTDSGAEPLSDDEPFTVTVLLPPEIGIGVSEGQVTLSFATIPGKTYRIEASDSLAAPWQQLGSATADDAGMFEYTDTPPPGTPLRIYQSVYP